MMLKDDPAVKQIAKKLGLGRRRDAEKAIREYCVEEAQRILKHLGDISGLDGLLKVMSSSLGIKFEEVHTDWDLRMIARRYLERGEILFADLHRQLDEKTDAILAELQNRQPWEHRYVAVIDCRGHKKWRAYFSKWHEVGHVLILSPQGEFQFRRTPIDKKDPEEMIVDRVAGDLAFYAPLFLPELLYLVKKEKRLSFGMIEQLRNTVCREASRESMIRAAVSRSPHPQLFVIANYGLKRKEERDMRQSGFSFEEEMNFEPKLRAVEVIANAAASAAGLRIHRNMEVPRDSIIYKASADLSTAQTYSAMENLGWWIHSKGQLTEKEIMVEVKRSGQRIFALISLNN